MGYRWSAVAWITIFGAVIGASAQAGEFQRRANVYTEYVATESGLHSFAVNEGLGQGGNRVKIFGSHRPTTLWSDARRTDCYEHSVRVMAQLPVKRPWEDVRYVQSLLRSLGLPADTLEATSRALNALKTNYVSGATLSGRLGNSLSRQLRRLNPKTVDGVTVQCTNLQRLGDALSKVAAMLKVADFALGAGLQEALAGDLALGRLQLLETTLRRRQEAGIKVDQAIFEAIRRTRTNLERCADYWGALLTELSDRRGELFTAGVHAAVRILQKNAVHLLASYYKKLGVKGAAGRASTVAGLWAYSLVATYDTIDALLDQHKTGQVAVTSATLACILQEEMAKQRAAGPLLRAMELQAEYDYYDKMVRICTGVLPTFYDMVPGQGRPNKEAREYFEKMRKEAGEALAELVLPPQPSTPSPAAVADGRSILIILDTSSSMQETIPGSTESKMEAAKKAVRRLLDTTTGPCEWALMTFNGCSVRILEDFTADKQRIRTALSGLVPRGKTPLAVSLKEAARYLQGRGRLLACDVVLLSDGKETCGGDPVEAARKWYGESVPFTTRVKQ